MVSSARVRFLKANVSLGLASLSSFSSTTKGRFFGLRDFDCSGCVEVLLDVDFGVVFVLVGGGRSAAQTSQQRKVDLFWRVHVGQVQGVSYELLSAVKSTACSFSKSLAACGSTDGGLNVAGAVSEGAGGGDDLVLGPAGFS
jgi:hypothetical protein